MVIKIVIIVILAILCLLSFINWFKNRKEMPGSFLVFVPILISSLAILVTLLPMEQKKIIFPEMDKMINENVDLKAEKRKLENELKDKEEKLEDNNKQLVEAQKNGAVFLNSQLYYKNTPIQTNIEESIVKVNGKNYFEQKIIEELIGQEINEDKNNKIMYIGKYPEKQVDLLTACNMYDVGDDLNLGRNDNFKIRGKLYAEGIKIGDEGSAKFLLENKYSELTFNMGHVDGTGNPPSLNLMFFVDGEEVVTFQLDENTDIDNTVTIPLNYGKIMEIKWSGGFYSGCYGLINLNIK